MPGLIPLILIIVPIIEITLFVQIGGSIGLGWTLFIILATAMIGARAIRRQGINALARAQAQMASGQPPVGEIVHGVLILIAGVLLLTPGFLTDALGFFLLFPAARLFVLEMAASFILPKLFSGSGARRGRDQNPTDAKIIDGDYRVEDPDD
ncbi:MAG: FxsA family protein [Rhizobiales bacterium TMED83]|jgi:UPF0716 protein FxsA|nr:hypothetical protein [Rhodobiaceae bacterium]RPF94136.1 MAG: FxsA family protein [Rhizobiales bacterium TMED83]